jgi:hypothetical protein
MEGGREVLEILSDSDDDEPTQLGISFPFIFVFAITHYYFYQCPQCEISEVVFHIARQTLLQVCTLRQ